MTTPYMRSMFEAQEIVENLTADSGRNVRTIAKALKPYIEMEEELAQLKKRPEISPGQALWIIGNLPKAPPDGTMPTPWRKARSEVIVQLQKVVDTVEAK